MRDKYTGDLDKVGRPHGHGTKKWDGGDYYEGMWYKGMRWGEGFMKFANGDVYEGTWWNDKRDGFGK